MSPLAILLLVVAAGLHAGWNLLSKRTRPTGAFFLMGSLVGAVVFLPVLVASGGALLPAIPGRVWLMLIGTSLCLAVYYLGLAGAYRAGDMSVAYPLARSSPVIVVTVVTVVLGRGGQVGTGCIWGILLVVGGCFMVPLRRFGELRIGRYLNATCGLALLAAFGTAGYSMIDDEALRLLRQLPDVGVGRVPLTLSYASLEAGFTAGWLALFVGLRRSGRAAWREAVRQQSGSAALTGLAIYVTYALVLIAFGLARNVSYVVAFRQLSIPLGASLGIWVLHEPAHPPKLLGVAIMVAGLILVALG